MGDDEIAGDEIADGEEGVDEEQNEKEMNDAWLNEDYKTFKDLNKMKKRIIEDENSLLYLKD